VLQWGIDCSERNRSNLDIPDGDPLPIFSIFRGSGKFGEDLLMVAFYTSMCHRIKHAISDLNRTPHVLTTTIYTLL
jgi:hypothetical protein